MQYIILDIETDGLINNVTRLHCLSYQIYENKQVNPVITITTYKEIQDFFTTYADATFVLHNGVLYDFPVLIKLGFIKQAPSRIVDTLAISWYLYPTFRKHGLEAWGDRLEIPKPLIKDWNSLTLEEYAHRCEQDVAINLAIFKIFFSYLEELYGSEDKMLNLTNYLTFKMDCLREQEAHGITLDLEACHKHLKDLESQFQHKTDLLASEMPNELGKVIKTKPKVLFKKNGELSTHGKKWVALTKSLGLDYDATEVIRETPNPGSSNQLKEWLLGLGWEPITFKESKATGKKVSQVSLPFGQGLCSSVTQLYEANPVLEELENYFKIKHRIGIFKSYIKNVTPNGKVLASAHGFANTHRLQHKEPVVNLPKPSVFYGEQIRGVLTVPSDEYLMCGADVSALEDSTKQHFIYDYDKEYVINMRTLGFDAHLQVAVLAELMTEEEMEFFKWYNNK